MPQADQDPVVLKETKVYPDNLGTQVAMDLMEDLVLQDLL